MSKELIETQESVDTAAALADISSDLFGQGESGDAEETTSEGERPKSSGEPSADVAKASPQESESKGGDQAAADEGKENSEAVQAVGAPSTWTKEALADWAAIPPRAQQEILKREEDALRGITQYKAGAELGQKYDSVVEPYRPILAAENIDPVQLFQSFAANHYLLSRGTPAQKTELAANLITGYGIDLNALLDHLGTKNFSTPAPEVQALQREVDALKAERQRQTESERAAIEARVEAEIAEFAADPAHPYFNELVNDISQLMGTGLAKSLTEAYEKAVYANPVTRQKELDRLTAANQSSAQIAEQARRDKIARSTAADVTTQQTSRNGTVPVGTMDDTLAETMRRITERS